MLIFGVDSGIMGVTLPWCGVSIMHIGKEGMTGCVDAYVIPLAHSDGEVFAFMYSMKANLFFFSDSQVLCLHTLALSKLK